METSELSIFKGSKDQIGISLVQYIFEENTEFSPFFSKLVNINSEILKPFSSKSSFSAFQARLAR